MTIKEQRELILSQLDEAGRAKRVHELEQSDIKVAKMRTRLKVHFGDLGLEQSMDALGHMCEKHGEQLRKNGELYIVHPLSMACRQQAMGVINDELYATNLLHDVVEDSAPEGRRLLNSEVAKMVADLPVGETVKAAVRLMTLSAAYPNEPYSETKRRYFQQFIDEDRPENKIALECKGFDRWDNITTITNLSKRAIRKNVLETSIFLLPVLKKAKTKWPREANLLYLLRTNIKDINKILAHYNGITDLNDIEELVRLLDDANFLSDSV